MDSTDLAFAGAARQAELIRSREVSSRELAELYLERIARLDPQLNAFRVVFARARARRGRPGRRARRGRATQRPLLGVPIAIKDDIDVAGEVDRLRQRRATRPAPADSEVVRRLRAAGAVIIGKTNVPGADDHAVDRVADVRRHPQPVGPAAHARRLAAAARRPPSPPGLARRALGSDGAGSIRIPAGCCGLFGLKAQRGRMPTAPAGRAVARHVGLGRRSRAASPTPRVLRRGQGRRAVVRRGRRDGARAAADRGLGRSRRR